MARRRRRNYRNRQGDELRRGYRGDVGAFVRMLQEQGEHVVEAAKAALKEGADAVAADAKTRVRVDTGALRDSITVVDVRNGTAYEIQANASKKGIAYGQFEEFAPWGHPFLIPAFEANKAAIIDSIKQAINNAVAGGS